MNVEVHFFSRLRDLAGAPQLALDLPEGSTIADLLARLYADHPAMQPWDPHLLIAVGLDYAARDQVLHAGECVSVMPPVQGG